MYRGIAATLLLVLVFQITKSQSEIKLNVEVLYESLCPDSLNFITQQLYPVWKELGPYVNLKLVPFGKSASLENGNQFVCQHGPQECRGNRIQSCVLHAVPNQNSQVEYVNCFMKTFRKNHHNEQGKLCAEAIGLNFNHVSQCYESLHGTRLQLAAEEDTVRISPKFVPTILYEGKFNQRLQDASLEDFRGVVCGFITQTHPDACRSPSVIRI